MITEAAPNNDDGTTLYQSPHKVKKKPGQITIISKGKPLPLDQHPRNFDELILFMAEHAITATESPDGFLFAGGTEEVRQKVAACLSSCIWTECNLRRYLNGTLKDINGRKYILQNH